MNCKLEMFVELSFVWFAIGISTYIMGGSKIGNASALPPNLNIFHFVMICFQNHLPMGKKCDSNITNDYTIERLSPH